MYLPERKRMTIKRKPIELISRFADLPRDMVLAILEYDDRFYLSEEGNIISRFARKDPRYVLLVRIPKINHVWGYYYSRGNIVSYMIHMVFLSKNKRHRFALAYYTGEDTFDIDENTSSWGYNLGFGEVRPGTRKVIFKNHYYSETVFFF
jgi:hypothetical protein